MEKQQLRALMKQLRMQLSKEQIAKESQRIHEQFLSSFEYKECDMIYSYASCHHEVETISLIKRMLSDGKRVALPCVHENDMDFYEITACNQLVKGAFGILEPIKNGKKNPRIQKQKVIVIVPGLAFDGKKNRIGYGKGYYDRYFHAHRVDSFIKIGFAYSFQMVKTLPYDVYDVPLDDIMISGTKALTEDI